MRVTIVDPMVRKNIARFQFLLKRYLETQKKREDLLAKVYEAYFNAKTGEICFPELKKPKGTDWTRIQLYFDEEGELFEISETSHPDSFDLKKVDKKALAIIEDTLRTLGGVCRGAQKHSPNTLKLKNIVRLEMELPDYDESKKSLIHEAWHGVDRFKAEYLLKNKKIGTYLFRKGEFAKELEEKLNEEGEEPVVCITLTYSKHGNRVCEKTLVFKNGEWLFYDDDVELIGKSYATIRLLMDSLEDLKEPLLAA